MNMSTNDPEEVEADLQAILDGKALPMHPHPVEPDDVFDAFAKVVRWWNDHPRFNDVRARTVPPSETIGEHISTGLEFLLHFVLADE